MFLILVKGLSSEFFVDIECNSSSTGHLFCHQLLFESVPGDNPMISWQKVEKKIKKEAKIGMYLCTNGVEVQLQVSNYNKC